MAWVKALSAVSSRRPPRAKAWLLGLSLFAASLLIRLPFAGWLEATPFLTFFPVIAVAGLLCGPWPATLVWGLCVFTGWYVLLPPRFSFALQPDQLAPLLGFAFGSGFMLVLILGLVEAVRRLEATTRVQDGLFRELQHRVANNMQIIASTLNMARRGIREPAALEAIEHAAARVASMARLHRRLYDRAAYRGGLEPVLHDILREAFTGLPVKLRIEIGPEHLSIDEMTTIVLFVNEAAINAAKHVFRPARGTLFEVLLEVGEGGRRQLVVRDDGPGIPVAAAASQPAQQLGMSIMQALAGQLGGALRIQSDRGTTLSVCFRPG